MRSRFRFTTCVIICSFVLMVLGSVALAVNTSPYYKIYQQNSPDDWDRTHNTMWCNVISDTDGTCYIGGNTCAGQQWRDEQISGTALLNWGTRTGETAKSIVPFKGHFYNGGANGAFIEQDAWNTPYANMHVLKNTATGYYIGGANGLPDGNANNKQNIQSVATDGEYIYSNDNTSAPTDNRNLIHKWKVDETNWTVTDEPGWPVAIGSPATCRFTRGLCLWNNKIYVVSLVSPFGVYEIDCATGTVSNGGNPIIPGTAYTNQGSAYSVARYGNDLFIPQFTGNVPTGTTPTWIMHTFHYDGTNWSTATDYDLGITNPFYNGSSNQQIGYFGVGLKGDGTNAQYMWLTSAGGQVSFWALRPSESAPRYSIAQVKAGITGGKNGYPIAVPDVVVTAVGANEFWVEDVNRISGLHVLSNGTLPVVNTKITLIGGMSTLNGEKVMNVANLDPGTTYTAKPVLQNGKSAGPAAGSPGLDNVGILTKICGKVTWLDWTTGAFYVDDGSGITNTVFDGIISTTAGIKVFRADGHAPDGNSNWQYLLDHTPPSVEAPGCFAVLTGVMRVEKQKDNSIIRSFGIRSETDNDCQIIAIP